MVLGRDRERQQIGAVLEQARAGMSGVLTLVGEPGIGKTALLQDAAERAGGMRVLRAQGIESEAQIPFASLLELVRPALVLLDQLPEPQAAALESALALRPSSAYERFAVGAATLSLLAAYAEEAPLLVLIDDAQWLDESSGQAIVFALRRLLAEPIAALVARRADAPSVISAPALPELQLGGLTRAEAVPLLRGVPPEVATRLHTATGGNPLAMLELVSAPDEALALAPESAPVLIPRTIARAFLRRLDGVHDQARRALLLAATSATEEISALGRAADELQVDLAALASAEAAGLVNLRPGRIEFRHPLVRSAVYATASPEERRAVHRALAASLPDRDVDRRAWHLAAAVLGPDSTAATALTQAGARARARSAYAAAAAAFSRAAQLTADRRERTGLIVEAAEASWQAGMAERAAELVAEARAALPDTAENVQLDQLAGHIATRRGPVMEGHRILVEAARGAAPEQAVMMLAEAATACFYAGATDEMRAAAARAGAVRPATATVRARFVAAAAFGMAETMGGDAAEAVEALREALRLAEESPQLLDDLQLLPWLALTPIFLREAGMGRALIDDAVAAARSRSALGTLPLMLNLIARDQATTDHWAAGESLYHEAIELAAETDQQTDLVFGYAGLAWLLARRGREQECREAAAHTLSLSRKLGTRIFEVWGLAALAELELGLGSPARAAEHFEAQESRLVELGLTDVDLWAGPELVGIYLSLGREDDARRTGARFAVAAQAKGRPWSMARALRARGLLADGSSAELFTGALAEHARTPDVFETARTRLAYGESLRRDRQRIEAREQLRAALAIFERVGADPWAERARTELAASGERVRRRDPSTRDELTAQELRIALLLAGGRSTREAAAALFLSPKTVEYHLRNVYMKLEIHSRGELAEALEAFAPSGAPTPRDEPVSA